MKKYSIILPVKNGGVYVKECVQSILAQSVTDFDLHVLDNCSNDGTLEWIKSLTDKRIIIYPSNNPLTIEQNWARIKEIEKNEFITLIGHDDLLYPEYLQDMEHLIQKHPNASLYQTHFKYIDAKGEYIRNCLPMNEVQYSHEFLACHMCNTIDSTGTGYMMRSVDYDEVGGMPTHLPNLIFSDYLLWIKLSKLSYKATSLKECFAYRINNSVSKITNGEDYIKAFEGYVLFLNSEKNNSKTNQVINRYGYSFLMAYCQALAHRLLKTPKPKRKLSVKQYIEDCKYYATLLIPNQNFDPLSKPLIKVAKQLDNNLAGRKIFSLYQKIKKRI